MTATSRYRVVSADPPWPFDQPKSSASRKFHGTVGDHYPVMSMAELRLFTLPPLETDCALFLWRVASMQDEALQVMRSWGFKLKTEVVWKKLTTKGGRHFGMGRIVRAEHEVCLVGVRGRPEVLDHSVRSVFEAPVGRHSAKPDVFYTGIVERLYRGPYVELFGRKPREGWTVYGNEVAGGVVTVPRSRAEFDAELPEEVPP